MSEIVTTDYEEINFFDLFESLWSEKWKIAIITFLVSLVGVIFNFNKDDVFQITVPLNNGKPEVFANYYNSNEFFKSNLFNINMDTVQVFDLVVREFNDYEEIISVIQKDDVVKEQIKDLDEESKLLFLMDYAKNFVLTPGEPDEQYMRKWTVSAKWNDIEKGKRIINDALQMTLANVKKSIINRIDLLSIDINKSNQQELEILNLELELISIIEENANKSRLQFLSEQALIARELGIAKEADNYIAVQLKGSGGYPPPPADNFARYMNERPFYLRGYLAIEKEIFNIQNRSKEEQIILSPKYLPLKEKIIKLENDTTVYNLSNFLENIKNDEVIDWVEFDISLAESNSLNRSNIFIFLSIIFGLILGCIYVLISKSYRKYRVSELNAH